MAERARAYREGGAKAVGRLPHPSRFSEFSEKTLSDKAIRDAKFEGHDKVINTPAAPPTKNSQPKEPAPETKQDPTAKKTEDDAKLDYSMLQDRLWYYD